MVTIAFSPKFKRQYKKLSEQVKIVAKDKILVFKINCFDPQLKTHKLNGRLKDLWSFWITHKDRVIFSFEDNDMVHFHAIGDHDIYE